LHRGPCYRLNDGTIRLKVFIQPNASCDEIVGPHGDAIKIRVSAKPIDGEANKHLIKYLAKCFNIKNSQIKICSGQNSRHKILDLTTTNPIPEIFCSR